MRVLIHHNFKKTSLKLKNELIAKLKASELEIVSDKPDIIITLGGDGTMLNAIRKHQHRNVPFIGINTGSLGFLPSVDAGEIDVMIDELLARDYRVNSYPLLKIIAHTTKGEKLEAYAFNEMIIKQAAPRLMEAKIFIDDHFFNEFAGDGLMLSTAIGSTGYAIWAGGAAMHPKTKGVQMIPLCPNDNAIHSPLKTPIILPESCKIDIKIERARFSSSVVGVDGIGLSKYAIADVSASVKADAVRIARLRQFNYFDLYSQKIIGKK